MIGTPEFKLLKVAALNLFHLTVSPLEKIGFFKITTQSLYGEGKGEGADFQGG